MPFNRKDHHNPGEIRPRFKLLTSGSVDEVFRKLDNFSKNDRTVVGKKVLDQYYLDIPAYDRHYWSPELRVTPEIHEDDKTKTVIRVMVGPRYTVWVLFVFMYTLLGLISLFGGMYGLTQLSLGIRTPFIWCFPVTALLLVGVYFTAKWGQRVGRDQTLHLVSVIYHALEDESLERLES